MKLFTPQTLSVYFKHELELSKSLEEKGDLKQAWRHLERAHILGQSYPFAHTQAHWHMLLFGFRIKSLKEVLGQMPRLLVGGIKSFVGFIPIGNTGGANVSAIAPMSIEKDLEIILKTHHQK